MSRRLMSVASVAAIVPCLQFVVPMATANAHGYVSSPPSRQAQCVQNAAQLNCGAIQYEPQSVEGPKGLRSCSGGNAKFAQLDNDAKPWKVTKVNQNPSFTWTFTANHRTSTWEYYIGNTRVGYFDGYNKPAPAGVTHTVDLRQYSGRQKLLAIWNIGDTVNAFYSCVDLQIGDTATPTTTTATPTTTTAPPSTTTAPPPTTTAPPSTTTAPPSTTTARPSTTTAPPSTTPKKWTVGAKYAVGETVSYDGKTYRCLQAHTVYDPNWIPPTTPALWQKV